MVSKKKLDEVKKVKELVGKYPVIGVIDLFKMPSRQLQAIKKELRGKALMRMTKKRLIKLVLEDCKKKDIKKLLEADVVEPALLFTEMDPFKLYKTLSKSKSPTYAKTGDIAPRSIVISAGATSIPAGPAIGEFQRVKIPAMVKEGRIHVRKDTTVVREGESISADVANILKKLDIQPMKIGINIVAAWEDGVVYGQDVLTVDEEEYLAKLQAAHINALNLSVDSCYTNKESIRPLLAKAYRCAKNLGVGAKILDSGVIGDLLAKSSVQAQNLKVKVNV